MGVDAADREPTAVEKEHERRLAVLPRVVQLDGHLAAGSGHGAVRNCRERDIGAHGGELFEQVTGLPGRYLV